jgi:hypothetical protein
MKKIYLFAAFLGFTAIGNAQTAAPGTLTPGKSLNKTFTAPRTLSQQLSGRSTATERWYSYAETMDNYWFTNSGGTGSELNANYLFPDTTILVDYGTSFSGPWIHNLGDVLDVASSYFNDANLYPGELYLTRTTPYRIDSMEMVLIYSRMINDPSIVDTLIFEVGVNATNTTLPNYYFGPGALATNLGTDTVFFKGMKYSYTTNSLNHTGKKIYKVPMDDNFYADSTADGFHIAKIATPDLPNVQAGKFVVTGVKFKPGYSWIANYDTLANKNSVRFLSFEEQSNSYPLYVKREYNVSYIVPQDIRYNQDPNWNGLYIPSYAYMGSSASYAYEHHWLRYKASTILTSAKDAAEKSTVLFQNEPNPFNRMTTIRYSLEKNSDVALTVYDVTGRIVKSINESNQGSGLHSVVVDATDFNKGVYFYTLNVNGKSFTKRMVISE